MSAETKPEPIVLVEPMEDAKARFEEERLRIAIALRRLPAAIEHIGSSAIAGIKTKPIVDVLVGMRALPLEDAVEPLVASGYVHATGAGGPERLVFKRVTDIPRDRGQRLAFHVHVVLHDDREWRRHVIFRDWLNLKPAWAKDYEALKIDLEARFGDDRARYTEEKTAFVERALAEAGQFPALRLAR